MNLCFKVLCSSFRRVRKIAKSGYYLYYFVSVSMEHLWSQQTDFHDI